MHLSNSFARHRRWKPWAAWPAALPTTSTISSWSYRATRKCCKTAFPPMTAYETTREQVLKAADRAASLTGQMLAFSRKQIISPVVLDLNAVINETAKMLKRLIGEDIEFRVDPAGSLWTIEADSDQIVQVLMNLCVNSRDAMPQGGMLTIATANITVEEGSIDGQPGRRAGGIREAFGYRYRHRHMQGGAGADIRTLLYHQGGRQRNGIGTRHGLRHRETKWRLCVGR